MIAYQKIPSKNKLLKIILTFIFLFVCNCMTLSAKASENTYDDNYDKFRSDTLTIQKEYMARITAHQSAVMSDLESKLKQQQWQTSAIAVMVIVMVAAGVLLSGFQFYKDFKSGGTSSVTFKLGSGSFEISSSVIGVVILAMSFFFFQTYIDRVYDVKIEAIPIFDFTTYGLK